MVACKILMQALNLVPVAQALGRLVGLMPPTFSDIVLLLSALSLQDVCDHEFSSLFNT